MATKTETDDRTARPSLPRIRIVHIQLLPILSGVQRVSLEEFQGLDPDIFESHLICQSPGDFTVEASRIGVQCHFANRLVREIRPRCDYAAYRQLAGLLREINPDIVHTHSSKTGLLGRIAARRAKVPVIVHTVHGFAFPATESLTSRKIFQACEIVAGRHCDAVICLNRSDEETTRTTLRVPAENVFRIPNGICLDRFEPQRDPTVRAANKQQRLGLDDRPLVINVGRLWEQKNPELFVRAACKLVREGLDCHFAMVGDGPLRDLLAQVIADSGASAQVHLLGWRSDVPEILPLADTFVLSSNWEGMPLVLLEANACGVPAVATDVAGSRDCIVDGETGLLARPNDVDDLAQKIRYVISNPDVRSAMATRCREHVQTFHDIRDRQTAIKNLYAHLLARQNRPLLSALIGEPAAEANVEVSQ